MVTGRGAPEGRLSPFRASGAGALADRVAPWTPSGRQDDARSCRRQRSPGDVFDLENPADVARLSAPMRALESLRGLVVIDEVQRMPQLFEILRVLADRPRTPAKFLTLGSADPRLVRGVSESLAGRLRLVHSIESASRVRETEALGLQERLARS